MGIVREKIRTEPMFRFDNYFRSRTESELNKRMQSIYRLIEKEKDYWNLGMDYDVSKDAKKKKKKKKEVEKEDKEGLIKNSNDPE